MLLSPRPRSRVSLRRRTSIVTPPLCLPVSVKDWETTMRIRVTVHSDEVQHRIKTATQLCERYIGRVLVAQTWDMLCDDYENTWPSIYQMQHWSDTLFWGNAIELPKPPMLSVLGIYVRDDFGAETLVPQNVYFVSTDTEPGRISLQTGQVWPYHRGFEGFRVRFVAGYAFPFQTVGGILKVPNHTLQSGQSVRIQRGPSEALPSGLLEDTNYTVTSVQPGSLQLLDPDGNLVVPDDLNSWNFVGREIPEPIRRAIVIASALEIGAEVPNKIGGEGRYAPVVLPITAQDLLDSYRFNII